MLYAKALTDFLTRLIFHFSVDNLIDALLDLVISTGMTTALVLIVVMVRERRKRKSTEA
ncbi:hypothetical protein [Streptomyces sp. SID12501]|uniref:Uncharacterized protein n=1 Tax=Streptomyces sp. SID12501 TaxID=2706042 RepID=A0A6B3BHD0_9ACTN|nr:hypothetical protein [Streptomyces sp. SID12501]NEC84694.1 hypothetical protein [Streptomyces sp. SID12501]